MNSPPGWLCLSALVLSIIGFRLTPFAVDFPDWCRLTAEPFGRIIDRPKGKFAQALAKLSKRNAGPWGVILLVDYIGDVTHSAFAFVSRTPAAMPPIFSTT
jgi:hypothetical protein